MSHMLRFLFSPPDMPELALPIPMRMIPGVRQAIGEAFKAAYFAGVMDGFLVGMTVATAIILGLALRGNILKGVSSVVSHI